MPAQGECDASWFCFRPILGLLILFSMLAVGFHRFGSMRFDYERSYAMLLGALRKHLKNDCFALDPSKHFDYIVSIFSEGSLRRFFDYLDADISMMTVHSAKGLEWDTVFIPGVARFDWPGGLLSVRKCWYVLAFRVWMPDCGCKENTRRAY